MSTTSPLPGRYVQRRAFRDLDESLIGGVAAGLARHLRLPVLWVRVGFVVLTGLSGLGVALYAGLWMMLPAATAFETAAPGLESATRGGRRPRRRRRFTDVGPVVVLAVLGIGALFAVQAVLGQSVVFWALTIAVVGVGLLWRQADEAQRERWLDSTGRIHPARIVFGEGGWAAYARVAAGLLLLFGAVFIAAVEGGSVDAVRTALLAAGLGIVGLGIVVGPWLRRLTAELSDERAERVRTQERADVAAHLHDSVLQTLALIQNNAGDPATVARLARSQERDLRAWLYSAESRDESTLASALRAAAAEVEDVHGISADVVAVGDCPMHESLRPAVAAAREAMTNSAKHAQVTHVDVYAEVADDAVDVFVRDRGRGFDPAVVPDDRHGVRHSIVDRMQRHGGTAEIRSSPGAGTEVRLHLPRTQPEGDS